MIIFNNTSADFVLISADALLKMIIILKELRITQLWSYNERTEIKTKSADVSLEMIIILKELRIAQLCS